MMKIHVMTNKLCKMGMTTNSTSFTVATSSNWNQPLLTPPRRPTFHLIFLKGQPKSLGIIQIIAAFTQIAFGIILVFTEGFYTYSLTAGIAIHFWGAVIYIIAGSLSVAAENTESRCLVSASLGWNILSAIVSSLEFVILIVDLVINGGHFCGEACITVWVVRETIFISLIVASLLELCVSISISSFGCSSLIENSVSQQIFVMQTDGLAHNIHPTISHLGVPVTSAVALIPHYPAFPTSYDNQKNSNVTLNNPNNSSLSQ
ncbi:membrane-spanning 4-domains subfamily A member 4D-like isoform X2 [Rhinoderma darwinii]|uniref:membrane-spanning 4-domains subfamily A member 4D-like isoform X2 n=1 Tax=Rhinoderma darwinii TaxID=43563 RepID=UPI003F67E9C5